MLKIVKMWDLAKQRIAVAGFSYYLDAVENSAALYGRYRAFLEDVDRQFREQMAQASGDEAPVETEATPPPEVEPS
jgi:hypothetical protein